MRVVALISGGKDSCYNMMCAVVDGHEIVALANMEPQGADELDSYMYQTVGHQAISCYAEAMQIPLFRRHIRGTARLQSKDYEVTPDDEVEDLFDLLVEIQGSVKFDAIAAGAILSQYQTLRVLNICKRLNLQALTYLWRRNQRELLQEMIQCDVSAILIKVAALGLSPEKHLGRQLADISEHLLGMEDRYGCNPCGEGGEYETLTLDCPLFHLRLVLDEVETVIVNNDSIAPVAYLNPKRLHLEAKEGFDRSQSQFSCLKNYLDVLRISISRSIHFKRTVLSETE